MFLLPTDGDLKMKGDMAGRNVVVVEGAQMTRANVEEVLETLGQVPPSRVSALVCMRCSKHTAARPRTRHAFR